MHRRPVLLFDGAGLSLFAVTGTQKALAAGLNTVMAALMGMCRACCRHRGGDRTPSALPVFRKHDRRCTPMFLLCAYLLQGLKIFHNVASRKHSDEVVSQHDWHLINSVPTHLFHCRPQFCVGIDSA